MALYIHISAVGILQKSYLPHIDPLGRDEQNQSNLPGKGLITQSGRM